MWSRQLILSANQQEAYNQIFMVSNDYKFSHIIDTVAEALQALRPSWAANEFFLRKLIILVFNWIKLQISSAQIDLTMSQTYYSNQKFRKTLDW